MEKPVTQESPGRQLLILLGIWWVIMSLVPGLQQFIGQHYFGVSGELKMYEPAFVQQHFWFTRLFQSSFTIVAYLLPPVMVSLIWGRNPIKQLEMNHVPGLRVMLITVLVIFFAIPFVLFTAELNQRVGIPFGTDELRKSIEETEKMLSDFTNAMLVMKGPADLVFNLLMFAFLPAIGEEMFFRGGIQRLLGKLFNNGHVAIIITAVLFSSAHADFAGLLPRTLLAILLGYMYYWSRNLWLPILAHMVYNGYQIVLLYFFGSEKMDNMQLSDVFPFAAVVVSVILLFLSMSWLYRRTMGRWKEEMILPEE